MIHFTVTLEIIMFFSACISGFRKGDSCVSQLLSIHFLRGFDANPSLDTRGVFLDISKAFDKVGSLNCILLA